VSYKKMKKSKTRTARVRVAAQKLKTFTSLELADEITDARKTIYVTIQELFKRGELKRIAPGRYEYVEGKQPVAEAEQRILRAIWIRGLFRIKNIKILADAEVSYIRRLVRRLILERLMKHFKKIGFVKKPAITRLAYSAEVATKAGRKATPRQGGQVTALQERIRSIAQDMENGEARMTGLIKAKCGVEDLRFCRDVKKLKQVLRVMTLIKGKGKG
jgi:predicted transcriptional regulator